MRRVRRALVLSLLAATVVVAPAATAASNRPTLVLVGRGNAYTDITLRQPLVLAKDPTTFGVAGCGRYGGFYLQPLAKPYDGAATHDFGLVDPTRFDFSGLFYRQPIRLGQAALIAGGSTVRLPAGRYRAHLFGEGSACRVTMPVSTGLARTLTIRPKIATAVQYADATLDSGMGALGDAHLGAATFPVTVAAHTYIVSAIHYRTHNSGTPGALDDVRRMSVCVDAVPAATCSPTHSASDTALIYQGRRQSDGSTTLAATSYEYDRPGELEPGSLYAKTVAENPAGEWTASAAMFGFDA
jgi:hypothetical protein